MTPRHKHTDAEAKLHPVTERLSMKAIDEFAELLRLLFTPVTALGPITSEKGRFTQGSKPPRSKFWPEGSLFHFIDMGMRQGRKASPFERFPNLLCDDGGVELADFIGWDCVDPRVAFVHTKCGWQPRVSASTLQSVCSQVIKNLAYLRYGLPKLPGWRVRWEHPWSLRGHELARLRAGTAGPAQARADLLSLLSSPTTRKEAWIVLGGTLPLSQLGEEVASGAPGPSVVQAMHLIIQTLRACAELQVGLRIFCPH